MIMDGIDVSGIVTGLFEPGWGYWALGIVGGIVLVITLGFMLVDPMEGLMFGFVASVMGILILCIVTFFAELDRENKTKVAIVDHYGIQADSGFNIPREGFSSTIEKALIPNGEGGFSAPQEITLTREGDVVTAWVMGEAGELVPLESASN